MEKAFNLTFSNGLTARAIQVQNEADLSTAVGKIGLHGSRPVLVVIGGASLLSDADLTQLRSLFVEALAPLAESLGVLVVDAGSDAGLMQLMGQARAEIAATFPLIGVVPARFVALPDIPSSSSDSVPLEPHHTHFVLVPGSNWGDESSWLADIANTLADKAPSVVVLINGGEITWKDALENIHAGRSMIVVTRSGRTADLIAAGLRGEATDRRAEELIASGLVQAIGLSTGADTLARMIKKIFSADE
jgi:hypothetical protein